MSRRSTQHPEFPDTFLPGVARAADRAMEAVLAKEDALVDALFTEVPSGLRPQRRTHR